jgi:hypothetical protein
VRRWPFLNLIDRLDWEACDTDEELHLSPTSPIQPPLAVEKRLL